jgi:hypothetical protein
MAARRRRMLVIVALSDRILMAFTALTLAMFVEVGEMSFTTISRNGST